MKLNSGSSDSASPIRTCVGCSAKRAKFSLIRLAIDGRGQVVWDMKQTRPGRGAYLCASRECLEAALKRRRFDRAFRRRVSVDFLTSAEVPWE